MLKNFPNRADIERVLDGRARDVAIRELQYYWCASYQRLKGADFEAFERIMLEAQALHPLRILSWCLLSSEISGWAATRG